MILDDDVTVLNSILSQIDTYLLTEQEVASSSNQFVNQIDYYLFLKDLLLNSRAASNSKLKALYFKAKENNIQLEEILKSFDMFIIGKA
jgi:hypothetical protein